MLQIRNQLTNYFKSMPSIIEWISCCLPIGYCAINSETRLFVVIQDFEDFQKGNVVRQSKVIFFGV
jgi:hypothetical protein